MATKRPADSDPPTSAKPSSKKPKTDDDRKKPNRQNVGLMDLLIVGGSPVPSTMIQDLAIRLLYAPRPMEDPTTIDVAKFSSLAPDDPNRLVPLIQLGPLLPSEDQTDDLCNDAMIRFEQQAAYDCRRPRPSYDDIQTDRECRNAWRTEAAEAISLIGRWHYDTDFLDVCGPLLFAPFWIDVDYQTVPAYALCWHGPEEPSLEFVFERDDAFRRLLFPAKRQPDYDRNGYVTACQVSDGGYSYSQNQTVRYDFETRDETIYSTAMAALDRSTGKTVGIGIIGSAVDFPTDLADIVLSYLVLPPIPPPLADKMMAWLTKQRTILNIY